MRRRFARFSRSLLPFLLAGALLAGSISAALLLPPAHSQNAPTTPQEQVLEQHRQNGLTAYKASDMTGAEKAWSDGLTKAQGYNNQWYVAYFWNNLGLVYQNNGLYAKAQDAFTQALTIRQTLNRPADVIDSRL